MKRVELRAWQVRYLRGLISSESGVRAELEGELDGASEGVLESVRRAFHRMIQRNIEGFFPVFARQCADLPSVLRSTFAEAGISCDRAAFIERAHGLLTAAVQSRAHAHALADLLRVERALALASFHRVAIPHTGSAPAHVHRVELTTNVMDLYPDIDHIEAVEPSPPVVYEVYFSGDADGVVARRLRAPSAPQPTRGRS